MFCGKYYSIKNVLVTEGRLREGLKSESCSLSFSNDQEKPKFGKKVGHATCNKPITRISFKVRRSNVKVTRLVTENVPHLWDTADWAKSGCN